MGGRCFAYVFDLEEEDDRIVLAFYVIDTRHPDGARELTYANLTLSQGSQTYILAAKVVPVLQSDSAVDTLSEFGFSYASSDVIDGGASTSGSEGSWIDSPVYLASLVAGCVLVVLAGGFVAH